MSPAIVKSKKDSLMKVNFFMLVKNQLSAVTVRQILDYLNCNGYWFKYTFYVRLNILSIIKVISKDFLRLLNCYQEQPVVRERCEANIYRAEDEIRSIAGSFDRKQPAAVVGTSNNTTKYGEVKQTGEDGFDHSIDLDTSTGFNQILKSIDQKARQIVSKMAYPFLNTKVRQPEEAPKQQDSGYSFTSPIFNFKLNIPLIVITLACMTVGDWCLTNQVLQNNLYMREQILGIDKSWFLAMVIVGMITMCYLSTYRLARAFMQLENNKKAASFVVLLTLACVALLAINGCLYFGEVEKSIAINNQIANQFANSSESAEPSSNGIESSRDLRFYSLCACTIISSLISGFLSACLSIYVSLRRKLAYINRMKRKIDQTYILEDSLYNQMQSNHQMAYQILVNIEKIHLLEQEINKTSVKNGSYSVMLGVAVILCTFTSSCKQQICQNGEIKTKHIAIGIDKSGSLDTAAETGFNKSIKSWLSRNIADSQSTIIISSIIGEDAGLNNKRQYLYVPVTNKAPSTFENDNDIALRKALNKCLQHRQKDSLFNEVSKDLTSNRFRPGHTCIFSYLYLLSLNLQNDYIDDVVIISDMKEDSKITSIHSFTSKQNAISLAHADLKKIQSVFSLSDSSLAKLNSITVILPEYTNDETGQVNAFLYSYWQAIMTGLGVKKFIIF